MVVGDAVASPCPIPEDFLKRAELIHSPVVVWPLREVDGIGIYSQDVVTLVKGLRESGVEATYLHPVGSRVFEVKKSFVVETVVAIGIGILSSAAWDGTKRVLRRRNDPAELDLTYVQLDGSEGRAEAWKVRGGSDAVLEAIDKLRATSSMAETSDSRGAPAVSEALTAALPVLDAPKLSSAIVPSGADDDLRRSHLQQQVRERREQGDALLASAAMKMALGEDARPAAEQEAREGLTLLARSLDWAEDSEFESEAHTRLDEAGRWVRSTFGCYLSRTGTEYRVTCPVSLAHNRIGMSIGGVAVRICSLCGEDFSECDHSPGTAYVVAGGADELGWCRICLAESCTHTPGDRERVTVVAIIREMNLEEVSLVSKPANPEARLTAVGVSTDELQVLLGPEFTPGMDVSCDKCLTDCGGLVRHDFGSA